jgi:hypothetical protein
MSIQPILTFRAGKCTFDSSTTPPKIKPDQTKGYIYLYSGDDLIHFCWRPRTAPASEPELDLLMFPGDGSFVPYTGGENAASSDEVRSPTKGRIFSLRFSSSSQRHLFWIQSHHKTHDNNQSLFSQRELKLGQIVDMMLSGEEVALESEISELAVLGMIADDEDEEMEDVDSSTQTPGRPRQGSGGAGPGATGGDVREEGEESREGGADGGRA